MTRAAKLTLEFRSWWLSGTGGGRGRLLDAACCRDADGLPAMPMSQVKGTLRETAERLAGAGQAGWSNALVTRLFGGPADDDGRSVQGAVAFRGDARIPEADRAGLAGDDARARRGMLYRRIASTAVDERGAAMDRTLRFVEAAAPVTLAGCLEWAAEEPPDADWAALLDAAAAATVAFGKMKAPARSAPGPPCRVRPKITIMRYRSSSLIVPVAPTALVSAIFALKRPGPPNEREKASRVVHGMKGITVRLVRERTRTSAVAVTYAR